MALAHISNPNPDLLGDNQALLSGQAGVYEALGNLVRAIGQSDFYERLAEILASVLGCDRWLVVRYSHYSRPEFIVNQAMTGDAVEFYHEQLYYLDPVFRLVRTRPMTGVLCLSQLHETDRSNEYFKELFNSARIFDEMQLLFEAPGRVCIVAGFERSKSTFSDAEITSMEAMFPLLESIHETHLSAVFRETGDATAVHQGAATPHCFQLLDEESRRIHSTRSWREREEAAAQPIFCGADIHCSKGSRYLEDGKVLHWEQLPERFAPAPRGYLCVIEEERSASAGGSFADSIEGFARHQALTPRERDIVALVFGGYPNSMIASKLNLCVGTVRNRRHKLYEKMDITTERELFNLFIAFIRGDFA